MVRSRPTAGSEKFGMRMIAWGALQLVVSYYAFQWAYDASIQTGNGGHGAGLVAIFAMIFSTALVAAIIDLARRFRWWLSKLRRVDFNARRPVSQKDTANKVGFTHRVGPGTGQIAKHVDRPSIGKDAR